MNKKAYWKKELPKKHWWSDSKYEIVPVRIVAKKTATGNGYAWITYLVKTKEGKLEQINEDYLYT